MKFFRLLIVPLGFCMLMYKPALSQGDNVGINKEFNFPSSFFNKVNQQSQKLEARLIIQTKNHLLRLIEWKKILQFKLSKVDSAGTRQLFAGSQYEQVKAKAKILTKMIYPTGGSQSFEYELNRWRDDAGNEYTGGGLRIKKVIIHDAVTSANNVRKFKYGLGEDGFGIGEAVDPDHYVLNKKPFYIGPDGNLDELIHTEKRILMCNPIMDYFFAGGSPVVYPETAEYYGECQDVNGKIISRYDYNYFFTRYSFEPVVPYTTLAYDYRDASFYGQLLEKVIFRKTANGFDSIQKQVFEYEVIGI